MRCVRLIAVLGLGCLGTFDAQLLQMRANAQEGGFQAPVNSSAPSVPAVPGHFTGLQEPILWHGRAYYYDVDAVQPLRPPKPGEHLGDYLIAEKLPPRYPLSAEPQRSQPSTLESRTIGAILSVFG